LCLVFEVHELKKNKKSSKQTNKNAVLILHPKSNDVIDPKCNDKEDGGIEIVKYHPQFENRKNVSRTATSPSHDTWVKLKSVLIYTSKRKNEKEEK